MKKVKRFSTFEELKSCESKTMKDASGLKKHEDFKKVMLDIRAIKIVQDNHRQSKKAHGGQS